MKQCTTCKQFKELSCFYKNKSKQDGIDSRCKECCDNSSNASKQKALLKRAGLYKEKKITEYCCRTCNITKPLAEFCKNKYSKHGHDYECKRCVASASKRRRLTNVGRQRELVTRAKGRAKKKGLMFDLSPNDIVLNERCPIMGVELDYAASIRQENSPSLDRIVPEKGYVKGNVVVISQRANRLKNDASVEEIERILSWLKENTH